jgi:plastocyanin
VLVQTAGHLHPGGLYTDLMLTRNGRTVNLFRSRARYWEPAGAVSWDVAMTATRPNWRIKVKRGDMLSVSATYDSKRGSWYESMGIMPVAFAPGARGGVDPFSGKIERRGRITHGHLAENDNHGGEAGGLADARTLPDGPAATADPLAITDFLYGQGDLLRGGAASRPPVVAAGQALGFKNTDAARTIFHTITACRAPCNRSTGIAYPLADGPVDFDSGELGFGPAGFTPAANRDTWSTPSNLRAGTYTYFCRVHPFMRGAFRVKG